MHRYFISIVIIIAELSGFATNILAQDYILKDVFIIEKGKLQRLEQHEDIKSYVERKDSTGTEVSISLGGPVAIGDEIAVKIGANVKLENSRRERLVWLNYGTVVQRKPDEPDGFKVVYGKAYINAEEPFRIFSDRLRLIQTSTEFYFEVNKDSNIELLYVFDGTVEVTSGTARDSISKKKAVESSNINELKRVTLYERDIERIEKWRSDIRWTELSWFGRLMHWPLRHPKISMAVASTFTTSGAVFYWDQCRGREKRLIKKLDP